MKYLHITLVLWIQAASHCELLMSTNAKKRFCSDAIPHVDIEVIATAQNMEAAAELRGKKNPSFISIIICWYVSIFAITHHRTGNF